MQNSCSKNNNKKTRKKTHILVDPNVDVEGNNPESYPREDLTGKAGVYNFAYKIFLYLTFTSKNLCFEESFALTYLQVYL